MYFREYGYPKIHMMLSFFLQYPELANDGLENYVPDENSTVTEQFIHGLLSAESRFKSNLVREIDTSLSKEGVVPDAPSSLPSIQLSGTI